LWFDQGELEQLVTDTGGHGDDPWIHALMLVSSASVRTKYLCPRCDEPLIESSIPGGPCLDVCPQHHGIWFDKGELQQVLRLAPETAGASRAIEFLNQVFATHCNPKKKEEDK